MSMVIEYVLNGHQFLNVHGVVKCIYLTFTVKHIYLIIINKQNCKTLDVNLIY